MGRQLIVAAALLASLSASSAWAQEASARCDEGGFVERAQDSGAEAYRVAVPGRSHFRQDGEGCPAAAACQLKSYLVEKDPVLVSQVENGWACAWYSGTPRDTVGWLRAADLARIPAPPTTQADWLGRWSFGEDTTVTITRDARGGLQVEGDTVNTGRPSPPTGHFAGALLVDGPSGRFSDFDAEAAAQYKAQFPDAPPPPHCAVRFRRVDRYLVVNDGDADSPWGCGGIGASFLGVYRR
ncbi:hypothetical protein [Caulobacter sp. LARHSG274]